MKKKLLLIIMCIPVVLMAQTNGVTVSNLAVTSGSPTTVTFSVSWETPMPVQPWSDTVWVFVDYNNAGKMERLPLLPGATLTYSSWDGAYVDEIADNNKGVWVVGNAKTSGAGSFSATVQLLTAATNVAGACAYASNYRPVAEYTLADRVSFTGTPMYSVVLEYDGGGTETQQVNSPFIVPSGYTLQSFTDKTGAPGIIKCIPMVGLLDFSASNAVTGQPAVFSVTQPPSTPGAGVTYSWRAPNFDPASGSGTPFNATAPAEKGNHGVTLTAHAGGYCDLSVTKQVEVLDCHGGRIGNGPGTVCPDGNDGGRIGING